MRLFDHSTYARRVYYVCAARLLRYYVGAVGLLCLPRFHWVNATVAKVSLTLLVTAVHKIRMATIPLRDYELKSVRHLR